MGYVWMIIPCIGYNDCIFRNQIAIYDIVLVRSVRDAQGCDSKPSGSFFDDSIHIGQPFPIGCRW